MSSPRREAASCVERGIERYAEGQYAAAQRELEQALALQPGHPRALECLAWVRELAAGRRTLSSDKDAIEADASTSTPSVASKPVQLPALVTPRPAEVEKLPELPSRLTSQLDDVPESVTREWSSMGTASLPQLDVPELSEEQIANLLDMDRGQGITLSAGKIDDSDVDEEVDDEEEDDERDRTQVRAVGTAASQAALARESSANQVYELVAEPEEPSSPLVRHRLATPPEPTLLPLSTAPPSEDSSPEDSPPTNPFVQQKVADLALLAGPMPAGTPRPEVAMEGSGVEQLEAAMQRGDKREIFELAEQLAARGGADEALLARAYERIVGPLDAVPRYGKAAPDLDSRSAFMLSRMDGAMTIDDLLDIAGMPRRDALHILARLISAGSVLTS